MQRVFKEVKPEELADLIRSDIYLKAKATQRAYFAILTKYLNSFKENPFLDPSTIKAGQYVNQLQESISQITVKKHVAALKHFYDVLIQNGYELRLNPFEPYQRQFRGKKFKQIRPTKLVSDSKVLEILLAPPSNTRKGIRDRAILALLFAGGLRRSEVVKLRLCDVETLSDGNFSISLNETKNGSDYEQPLATFATKALSALVKQRRKEDAKEDDPLFVSYIGENSMRNAAINDSTLYKMFLHYARKVGLPKGVAPHAARATAITKLLRDGLDYRSVQEFSRHSSVQMVEVYDKRVSEKQNHPAKKLKF